MGYYKKIEALFKKDFQCESILTRGSSDNFTCPLRYECKVNTVEEPIWTPGIGDENTEVMIVAEAPSRKGGKGPHIFGLIKDKPQEKSLDALFNFVKEHFNTIPYFTDLMKCGVARQTKESKKIFKIRRSNCLKHYLLKEIEIIEPKIILCVGSESYNDLQNVKESGQIRNNIKLIKLIHYGKQANLPLSYRDKEELIWPYQVGKIEKKKMNELDFFNKKK